MSLGRGRPARSLAANQWLRRTGAAAWPALISLAALGGPGVDGAANPAAPGEPSALPSDTTLSESAANLHLLRRATFGVTPATLAEVATLGRDRWLERQLDPERIHDAALEGRLAPYPAARMSIAELYERYPPPNQLRARLADGDSVTQEELQRLRRELGVQGPGRILFDLAGAKLQRAVHSERQLEEVMTDFWFNHFNVFFGKGPDRWLIGDYERGAIRPHVFGAFEDLLLATATHPAMLVYLDNWQSSVPDSLNPALARVRDGRRRWERLSPSQRDRLLRTGRVTPEQLQQMERLAERRAGRLRGINENYARELLELHTLGVDGGYTQDDVVDVARAFTGWTIIPPGRDGRGRVGAAPAMGGGAELGFVFRPEMHYPGAKRVLGVELSEDGVEEGRAILRMLARHPSTARHVATKLARAFVSDDPPPELVDELSDVFLVTGGDLRAVTRALFSSNAFYDPVHFGSKLKSPFELVASALRATEAEFGPSRRLFEQLRALDHTPYLSTAPTGYPEVAEEWTSSGALLQRMNFGLALAGGGLGDVRTGDLSIAGSEPTAFVEELLAVLLPGTDTGPLEATLLSDAEARAGLDRRRALGLALGSPEFQKH